MKRFDLQNYLFVLLTLCLLCTKAEQAGAQQPLKISDFAKADSLVRNYPAHHPGFVLAISQNGQTIYEKAAGMASLELGVPMSTDHVFEAASVSKQFTATTILKLVEKGLISLDDDIHKYFPELPDYGDKITIRHLLTMTSGLRDWRNITYLTDKSTSGSLFDLSEALEIIRKQHTLNFKPGELYSYSNTNYDLLSILVYRVTKVPFTVYSTKEVLDPVDMIDSRWRTNSTQIVKNGVNSYSYNSTTKEFIKQTVLETTHGAAGMLLTARDLLKWADFWAANGFGDQLTALRTERGILNSGREIYYALGGVRAEEKRGTLEISHSGLIGGYRGWVAHYPEQGISVSYLTNNRSFESGAMQAAIIDALTASEVPTPTVQHQAQASTIFKDYPGLYKGIDTYNYFELTQSGNFVKIGNDTLYTFPDDIAGSARINNTVYIAEQGKIQTQVSDEHFNYRKVEKWNPAVNDLKQFEGTYTSNELDMTIELKHTPEGLFAIKNGYIRIKLNPTYIDGEEVGFYTLINGLRTLFCFEQIKSKRDRRLIISIPRAENFVFTQLKQ